MKPAALVSIAVLACSGRDRPPPLAKQDARPAERVVTAPDAARPSAYVGVITAAESVDIAPRSQGVVMSIHVRVGDSVTAGEIVAEIDPQSMREELRAAQASLGAAQAAYRQAAVDLEDARRKAALEARGVADGVTATAVLEEAKLAVKRSEAALQKASSTVAAETSHVQTARDHVNDTALRAPSNGTVAIRYKDPGATVAAGAPILRIVEKGELRLRFAVPPDRAQALTRDTKISAKVDTIAQPVAAIVRQVSPALDPASGMIIIEAELAANAEIAQQLRPGLAAWIQ